MIKYVIDYVGDKLRHFKSDTLDHDKLARDNGIDSVKKLGYSQIINF